MKKPQLKVRKSKSKTHPWLVDLRAYGKGRKFFKHKSEVEAEVTRQRTLLERHSREAIGLSPRELSDFITARNRMAKYDGATIADAVEFFADYQERVLRCNVTTDKLPASS